MTTTAQTQAILEWFATGERGLSSETIARHLIGQPHTGRKSFNGIYTPSDPADFRRCMLLVESLPEPSAAIEQCRSLSKKWTCLVDDWAAITETLKREMADKALKGRASETYKMIKASEQRAFSEQAGKEGK